jgi:hypothetical protein
MKHNYTCKDLDCPSCGLINKITEHQFHKSKNLACTNCKCKFNTTPDNEITDSSLPSDNEINNSFISTDNEINNSNILIENSNLITESTKFTNISMASSSGSISFSGASTITQLLESTKKLIQEKSKKAKYSNIKVCNITMHINTFVHAKDCTLEKCTYKQCKGMKTLINHNKKCLTFDDSCEQCNCIDYIIDKIDEISKR